MGKSLQGGGNFSPSTIYLRKEIKMKDLRRLILSSSNIFSKIKLAKKQEKSSYFAIRLCN
jgi:hypothetical protein